MKKRFFAAIATLVVAGLLALPATAYAANQYNFQVKDEYGDRVASPTCEIFAAGTRSTSAANSYTVYTDRLLSSSKTNPTTADSNGVFTFYTATSVTSVDAVCYTNSGNGAWGERNSLTVNQHSLVLDPNAGHFRIAFSENASETDTAVDLPYGAVIEKVWVETATPIASGTIDVGLLSTETAGDADGFCDGVSTAPGAGTALGYTEYTDCESTTEAGDLLTGHAYAQADTGPTVRRKKHVVHHASARSISYTTSAHASTGYINILFDRL